MPSADAYKCQFIYRVLNSVLNSVLDSDHSVHTNHLHLSCAYYQACIFNCQLGRGRTTTGMVIACILWRRVQGLNAREWDTSRVMPWSRNSSDLDWGEYRGVNYMMSALETHYKKMVQRKQFVDAAIDKCAHMQNIRSAILEKKIRAEKKPGEYPKGVRYLERYIWLILFNMYVCAALDISSSEYRGLRCSFAEWVRQLSKEIQLYPMLDRLQLE